jgi:hypothetical protein
MNLVLPLPHEPRPRDFVARLPRRGVRTLGLKSRRRRLGRRLLVLLAAATVPAFAAPADWRLFEIGNAGRAEPTVEPMPFERSGDSFPGSAFYYLAIDPPRQAGSSAGFVLDSAVDAVGGPIARAMRMDLSGVDRGRALDCLTAAVYYEAASESDQGQRAVAQVVLNRVAHPSYPGTVCGVVYQGSERATGCQFTFTCDGSLARRPNRMFWDRARSVATSALAGYVEPAVGLATHYHTIQVHPYWAPSLNHITTIGAHRFYSFKGRAGQAGTFRFAFAGGEPVAAPHARNAAADLASETVLDPLALQRAYDAGFRSAQAQDAQRDSSASARAPTYVPEVQSQGGDARYRGDKLPAGGQGSVRPEYEQSGRWIAQPGT